ncbi:MAG: phage holin family protein [Actinomycetes bacterium]
MSHSASLPPTSLPPTSLPPTSLPSSTQGPAQPSLGELVASASRDLSTLVRDEIELAKTELKGEVKAAATGGGMFGAAGFLALLASVMLSIALAFLFIALGLAPGWAFLIVAVIYLIVAGILGFVGLKAVKKVGPPERAIRSTKDTIATLKQAKSAI